MMVIGNKRLEHVLVKSANDLISLENQRINIVAVQDCPSYDVRKEAHGQYEYIPTKINSRNIKLGVYDRTIVEKFLPKREIKKIKHLDQKR